MSNSTPSPSLDGKGGMNSAAKVGKSTNRAGGYGVPYCENSTARSPMA